MLASYLTQTKKRGCSVRSVYSQARDLKKKGIDTPEALDAYIKNRQHDNPHFFSFRSFFQIWLRPLSENECELALKWFDQYGYTEEILSKAYDASIQASKGQGYSLNYIDTVLTKWHEAGCKTVEECIAYSETYKAKLASEASAAKDNIRKRKQEKTADVPKYGNFNIEEVFAAALERSYSEDCD
jgi:DnaD/phage-associated family protein